MEVIGQLILSVLGIIVSWIIVLGVLGVGVVIFSKIKKVKVKVVIEKFKNLSTAQKVISCILPILILAIISGVLNAISYALDSFLFFRFFGFIFAIMTGIGFGYLIDYFHPQSLGVESDSDKTEISVHGKFEFRGEGGSYLWLCIWTGFVNLITLGLFLPWAIVAKQKWIAKNTYIDGNRTVFKGTGGALFGNYLLIWILTVITLGIYFPWGYCRIQRWIASNTYFADEGYIEK